MIPPLENLKVWAGAGAVAFILSASFHLDGPSDFEAAQATEASLNDALAQAQAERPELWSDEQKARARVAAVATICTEGDQPQLAEPLLSLAHLPLFPLQTA